MANRHAHFSQIDILKGMAIILVLFGHTFSYSVAQPQAIPAVATAAVAQSDNRESVQAQPDTSLPDRTAFGVNGIGAFLSSFTRWKTFSALLTQQVVPIFLVLMALNFSLSYRRRGFTKLSEIYTKNEFVRRFRRFFVPFAACFLASLCIGAFMFIVLNKNVISISVNDLPGFLPIDGPGNYFISLIFEFVFVFPLMYILYIRYPRFVLIGSFAAALAFELIAPKTGLFTNASALYTICIIRFLPLLALGLWISNDWDLFSKRNLYIVLPGILSMFYLVVVNQPERNFYFMGIFFSSYLESQNLFASFYPVLLVLAGMKYLPQYAEKWSSRLLSLLGNASYHIFLVQIIYFGVNVYLVTKYHGLTDLMTPSNILIILVNLTVCISLGLAFYYLDRLLFSGSGKKLYLRPLLRGHKLS